MRHIAAYLLVVLGGNATPSSEDVKAVITAAGGEADDAALELLFSELEGKSIEELLAEGKEKLKSVASAGPSSAAAPAAGGAAPAAKEEKAPAPKVEEVDALEGGMDMFGGGGDY